ncbi:hypothetical protein ACFQX6_53915 [Streptosporangium lutulentum]
MAAANPRSSAADGWELSAPLANRFVHLQWVHDHEVVVRGLGGTWPRASLPRLDPDRLSEAVTFARRAVCGLLAARPALVHRLPGNDVRRGGPWPSPRSWEMTLRLIAFATAANTSREVLSMLVRGTVGDGPGLELLAYLDRMDLPDPEALLADPAAADLPERGDLRQAVLDGVVEAVRKRPEKSLLGRGVGTAGPGVGDRSPGPGGRTRDHTRRAAPRGVGCSGVDREARRGGGPGQAGGQGRGAGRRRGSSR